MVSTSNLKLDLNLESPFIKIMHECITKTFKNHKKFIEKEIHAIAKKITQIKSIGANHGIAYTSQQLDVCINNLEKVKQRYNKLLEAEDYLFEVLKKRLNHLLNVSESQMNPEIMKDYFTKRLNRIIIDYLLRENYFESAKQYVQETQLKEFADIEVFEETYKIISKLKHRDCADALNWCNTHKTKLQKNQHYVDEQRWLELEELFLKESYSLFSLPLNPMITQTLQTGISVVKTEFCEHSATFNEQCPTCSPNIRKLGHKLPFSHQTQTSIMCPVTKEIMNEQNPPLYLPTGYVISEKALEKLEDPNNSNQIKCPITGQFVSKDEIKKVYFI